MTILLAKKVLEKKGGLMTDAEADTIIDLYYCDHRLFWRRCAKLSPKNRKLVLERSQHRGRQTIRREPDNPEMLASSEGVPVAAVVKKPGKKARKK